MTAIALLAENAVDSTLLLAIIGVLAVIIVYLLWRVSTTSAPAPAPVAPVTPPVPAKPSCEPVRLLAVLQREGRLLDFLLEDVSAYSDDQVGAAVRDIHRSCRKALLDHLTLEPVMAGDEGAAVTVPAGFDPSAVRLTGNVTGQPPFRGTLRHHGWRVKELKLAPKAAGQDEFVVQPAEVEL